MSDKVLIIGLDCATPRFLFDEPPAPLPTLDALRARGRWGVLRSCDPPITVPAWACMTTGLDPGVLGCYGFRNRTGHTRDPMKVATARAITAPRIWDLLGDRGRKVIVHAVPQTWPPAPVNGALVTGLLTPDTAAPWTWPDSLSEELERQCGGYTIDVADFRTDDTERLFNDLTAMLENRFRVARHLLTTRPWDFFMMVETGLDRLHHAFWKFADVEHPDYTEDHPGHAMFRSYYERLDARIGELLDLAPPTATVLVVSDHGAKAIHGGIRINQWLIERGYLALDDPGHTPHMLDWSEIDWSRTTAWSTGGYYARIFINLEGREAGGIVRPEDYDGLRARLAAELESMTLADGAPLGNVVLRPEDVYEECNGVPPDLLVYFGNLRYRAIGTVGTPGIFADGNDTGPDHANHAMEGVYILSGPGIAPLPDSEASIFDVAPTVLSLLDVARPGGMRGRSLV